MSLGYYFVPGGPSSEQFYSSTVFHFNVRVCFRMSVRGQSPYERSVNSEKRITRIIRDEKHHK